MTSPFDTLWTPHNPVLGWWAQEVVPAVILTSPLMSAATIMATPTLTDILTAPTAHAAAAMAAPTVSLGSPPISLTAPTMTAVALIPAPKLAAALTAPAMTAAGTARPPALTFTATAPAITAAAAMPAPTIAVPIQITAPTMHAAATIPTPALSNIVIPPLITAAAAMPAPTVTTTIPITFDAAGTGGGGSASSTSSSWTHTAAAGATVLAFIANTTNAFTPTAVTYGGVAMTQKGSIALNNNGGNGILYLYILAGVPGGTQTVQYTFSGAVNACANTVSDTGVSTVGTPVTAFGSGASPSQAVTNTGGMIVQAFAARANGLVFNSTGGGTQRFNGHGGVATAQVALAIQDSTATATFTGALSAAAAWGGIAVVLS